MPLFEAISNAIDAIDEHKDGFLNHAIRIRLVATHYLAHQGGDEVLVLDGFDISDDGVGFDDRNLASSQEAHTSSKVKVGGKGVGRFTFLKVFSNVHIRSVFQRQGETLLREFDFSIADELKGADKVTAVKVGQFWAIANSHILKCQNSPRLYKSTLSNNEISSSLNSFFLSVIV